MKVFLSSTFKDLAEYRQAASRALEGLGLQVLKMEDFGARTETATIVCSKEIAGCEFFIGIYAHHYGFIPPGSQRSMVEQEFLYAREIGRPMLCFIVKNTFPWNPEYFDVAHYQQLRSFTDHIKNNYVVAYFNTPEDLELKIASAAGSNFLQQPNNLTGGGRFYHALAKAADIRELVRYTLGYLAEITGTDYNQIFLIATDQHM